MNQQNPFKWRHFEAEIILLCVRWYLRWLCCKNAQKHMGKETPSSCWA